MRSRRAEVQDSLQSRYRVTRLGPGMLGIHGSDNSVRRAGGIIVLRREGLYGSFDRARMPLNAIHGDTAELLAGDKAQAVPMFPGQRFYVVAVNVSDDAVTLGLLSTGPLQRRQERRRLGQPQLLLFQRNDCCRSDGEDISCN